LALATLSVLVVVVVVVVERLLGRRAQALMA
jgi:hypothetical protein